MEKNELRTMQDQIIQLESKIAFQEDTIEILNQMVTQQQFDLDKLQAQIKLLTNKIKGVEPSLIALPHEETPPPHY